jgi:hypothetical protein
MYRSDQFCFRPGSAPFPLRIRSISAIRYIRFWIRIRSLSAPLRIRWKHMVEDMVKAKSDPIRLQPYRGQSRRHSLPWGLNLCGRPNRAASRGIFAEELREGRTCVDGQTGLRRGASLPRGYAEDSSRHRLRWRPLCLYRGLPTVGVCFHSCSVFRKGVYI